MEAAPGLFSGGKEEAKSAELRLVDDDGEDFCCSVVDVVVAPLLLTNERGDVDE
jgi:hypothetical protein